MRILLPFVLFLSVSFYGQSVNDYKYAMCPLKFAFQNSADQYKLNTYTKMFMEKYGFEAWLDNETIPVEIANSNCNKIFVDVIDGSGIMATKLTVVLKDCTNKVLFTSAEGQSRDKDYRSAYTQALRQAFASFENLKYKYNDINDSPPIAREEVYKPLVASNTGSVAKILNVEELPNGFQAVDGTSIVIRAWKTELPNTFIAKKGAINGILFMILNKWYFQYYENEKLITEAMDLRFN